MPGIRTTNFVDSNGVDLGKKLVTKDYLLEVYGSILENSPASGLIVTPELWVWGEGGYGRLGTSNSTTRSTPVTTSTGGTNWKQVSSGPTHTGAIKTDGTLWMWGAKNDGRLGINDGGGGAQNIPVTTFAGGTTWKQVSAGNQHTAAIKTDGTLWIWGDGDFGKLGTNDTTPKRTIPATTFVGGTDWKQVSCSPSNNTAAIKTDGTLWVWGRGINGVLGINNTDDRSIPVTTFAGGTTWKQVSAGNQHTAAIKTDGTLWIWGRNSDSTDGGNLGTNDNTNRNTPVTTFSGGTNWKSVSTGNLFTVAIKTDGTLWTWGRGTDGKLGINAVANSRSTPVTTFVGGTNWKLVSCTDSHISAIKTDGSLWTWGLGTSGQLGDNTIITKSTPVTTFAGGNNWKSVAAGGQHTSAIQTIDYI